MSETGRSVAGWGGAGKVRRSGVGTGNRAEVGYCV